MAIVALVFAMTGGAFAVTSKNNGSSPAAVAAKKKAKKLLRGPRGPRGPRGATGPIGLTGSAGPAGPIGKEGAVGQEGPPGKDGTNGKSVTTASEPKGANCAEGGSSFQVEGATQKTYACNGLEGKEGKEGSPWTAGGTLPSGKTETGAWAIAGMPGEAFGQAEILTTAITFNIPLAAKLGETQFHVIAEGGKGGGPSEGCPTTGTAENPEAESGNLCLYVSKQENVVSGVFGLISFDPAPFEFGAGKTGAILMLKPATAATAMSSLGTWAVTG
jgi:Collagen triple helix repeat (20 copies)